MRSVLAHVAFKAAERAKASATSRVAESPLMVNSDHGGLDSPADYGQHGDDDVFGSAGKALDEPIAFAALGDGFEFEAAMVAIILGPRLKPDFNATTSQAGLLFGNNIF